MSALTILVNYDLGGPDEDLTAFAAGFAERLDAEAIGVCACPPLSVPYADGFFAGDVIEQDRLHIEGEMQALEARFRAALGTRARDWRSAHMPAADFAAGNARAADIIIAASSEDGPPGYADRRINLGDLVMRAGRPVLVVPPATRALDLDCALVGWKDSREARRAISDALPLLKKAGRVVVVTLASGEGLAEARFALEDVVHWLDRHGVVAEPLVTAATGSDSDQLARIADEQGAGLFVGGAYGKSRLREWVLGGVTNDLLMRPGRPTLLSH